MTKLDLAYLGGLFDGEGSAGVYIVNRNESKLRKSYKIIVPVMQLRMLDKDPVKLISQLGGWFGATGKTKTGKGPIWCWRASCKSAFKAAKILLPFLKNKSKIKQVKEVINRYNQKVDSGNRVSQVDIKKYSKGINL